MARDKINLQHYTYDATDSIGVVELVQHNVVVANGIEIANAFAGKDNSIEILITNSDASDNTITVKAGQKQNCILGDIKNQTVKAGKTVAIDLMRDMARFERDNGSVYIDFGTGFTGTIAVFGRRAGLRPKTA